MGWATGYISALKSGQTVLFRPRGNSMAGKIENGQLVTVEPVKETSTLTVGSIVLCKVNGQQYLHLIKAVGSDGRYLIGNNQGRTNGWVHKNSIFGICVKVEP